MPRAVPGPGRSGHRLVHGDQREQGRQGANLDPANIAPPHSARHRISCRAQAALERPGRRIKLKSVGRRGRPEHGEAAMVAARHRAGKQVHTRASPGPPPPPRPCPGPRPLRPPVTCPTRHLTPLQPAVQPLCSPAGASGAPRQCGFALMQRGQEARLALGNFTKCNIFPDLKNITLKFGLRFRWWGKTVSAKVLKILQYF